MSAPDTIEPVYMYRLAPASAAQVQQLVRQALDGSGWAFGGAAIWDLQGAGRENLRPIVSLPADAAPNVSGDFGHAFNKNAEVRWKRIDAASYDVLVLAEQPLPLEGVKRLERGWKADKDDRLVAFQTRKQDDQTDRQPAPSTPEGYDQLWGRYYYGPGEGAVLVRYTRLEEANR